MENHNLLFRWHVQAVGVGPFAVFKGSVYAESNALILGIVVLVIVVGVLPCSGQNIPMPPTIQVRGRNLTPNRPFTACVKNDLATAITFCVDFGKTVQTTSGQQAAPNPFEVQKWNGNRWDTQLIGTDVASGSTAISIDAKGLKNFSLKVNASGRYRLRLTYLESESETKCPLPAEGTKITNSKPFMVRARDRLLVKPIP